MPYVALITGASSGIGEATARRLAREPDVQLILVARREERLLALAEELAGATAVVADLTDPATPSRIAEQVERDHGALNLLVNNAGARWAVDFADGGWSNVERHMRINFEAPVRLVEALLPLHASHRCSGVGAAGGRARSPAAPKQVSRPASEGARSRRRWRSSTSPAPRGGSRGSAPAPTARARLRSALGATRCSSRSAAHGVHVADVLPGFIATEGFPQSELKAKLLTSWAVSDPEQVAEAIIEAGPGGVPERYVPRYYWMGALLRVIAPSLIRRGASSDLVPVRTRTASEAAMLLRIVREAGEALREAAQHGGRRVQLVLAEARERLRSRRGPSGREARRALTDRAAVSSVRTTRLSSAQRLRATRPLASSPSSICVTEAGESEPPRRGAVPTALRLPRARRAIPTGRS